MTSVTYLQREDQSHYDRGMRVNVTALIIITTLVSTLCSVVGGVWLYFQSVQSLEGAVNHSSDIEVDKLKGEILQTYKEVQAANHELRDFLMPAEMTVIKSPIPIVKNASGFLNVPVSATEEWANLIRWKVWSRIKNSDSLEAMGIVLVPWEKKDPTGQYTNLWYDLKADGSREYVYATYGQNLGPEAYNNVSPDSWSLVIANALYENNGSVSHYVYNYSFNTFDWPRKYGLPLDGDFSKYTNDTYPGDTFVHGTGGATIQRFRPPSPWYASDRNPYVFTAFDVGFPPPPPPHPWSQYKQIWLQTYFVFNTWEETITQYAQQSKDTTVMIYDQTTTIVYASTTGGRMIDSKCWTSDLHGDSKQITDCVTKIINTTAVEQAAWASAAGPRRKRDSSVFWKASLNGSPYFMRHAQLFTFIPAGGTPSADMAILWFQTTASVQRKVFQALTVFIIFACTVFVFDVCMAMFEIYLVAIPLTRIARSLGNLKTFEPEVVREVVNGVTLNACLSVKEVHEVAKGLDLACLSLIEYKAFLPTTLFADVEHDATDDDTHEASSRKSRDTQGTATGTGTMETSTVAAAVYGPATGLCLQQCCGSFIKLSFVVKDKDRRQVTADSLTAMTEAVEHAANLVKGTVHAISPCELGVFYVSLNISRKCADAPHKAAMMADALRGGKNNHLMNVCIGLGHGTVFAGNIGSRTLRGFGMHGGTLSGLHAAHTYACRLEREVGVSMVVVNERVAELMTGLYSMMAMGVVKVGTDKPTIMYCMKEPTNHEIQEWMYQLEEGKTDPLVDFFTQVARNVLVQPPAIDDGSLCDEQKVAIRRARSGVRVEFYTRDGFQAAE